MKTEDCSNENIEICLPESNEKQMGRREVLNKVTLTALSTATMMILMKSAKASGLSPMPPPPTPSTPSGTKWQRTTRS